MHRWLPFLLIVAAACSSRAGFDPPFGDPNGGDTATGDSTQGDAFVPGDATPTDWWDTRWRSRQSISFSLNESDVPLQDFPLYVQLSAAEFEANSMEPDGSDVRFVDSDGTVLAFEQQGDTFPFSYWVRVPQIATGTEDFLWVYYTGPNAPLALSSTTTWESNYVGVWHLDENGEDSTANANNGNVIEADPANGLFGPALSFSGTPNDRVEIPDDPSLQIPEGEVTMSGWVFRRTNQPTWRAILSRPIASGGNNDLWFGFHDNRYRSIVGNSAATQAVPTGATAPTDEWIWVVTVFTGTEVAMYVNGEVDLATVLDFDGMVGSPNPFYIGADTNNGGASTIDELDGIIDEVRLESVARTSQWIRAQYQSMTGALTTFGDAQNLDQL